MLHLGLNKWLSYFSETSQLRVEEHFISLGQEGQLADLSAMERLLKVYGQMLMRTEQTARLRTQSLISGFLGKHRPQSVYCTSDLAMLGLDLVDTAEIEQEPMSTEWYALGCAYTLEVASARLFQFFAKLSAGLPRDLNHELNFFSTENFLFKDRWIDFMDGLSTLEQEGVNRFQFDEMLEGVLTSLNVWEDCFENQGYKLSEEPSLLLEN